MLCDKFGHVEGPSKGHPVGRWQWDAPSEAKVYYCAVEIPSSPLQEYCVPALEVVGVAGFLHTAPQGADAGQHFILLGEARGGVGSLGSLQVPVGDCRSMGILFLSHSMILIPFHFLIRGCGLEEKDYS